MDECARLLDSGQYREAIALCDEIIRGRTDGDDDSGERVAFASLRKGIALGRLGRGEDAIAVYDELIARYAECADGRVRRHVAWAYTNKAEWLRWFERIEAAVSVFEELAGRFDAAREPKVRVRVGWALWHQGSLLGDLGRTEAAELAYDKLSLRCDEGLDEALGLKIAWCLAARARRLGESGDVEAQVALCSEFVDRFGDGEGAWLRERLLDSLTARARGLARLGRRDQELEVYDEIAARFGEETNVEARGRVAEALLEKAKVLIGLRRSDEAVAACDDALARLVEEGGLQLRERAVSILLRKGMALTNVGRAAESVVVYDSAVAVYVAARSRDGEPLVGALRDVVLALSYKVARLCELHRSSEVDRAREQLIAVLGDVAAPKAASSSREEVERVSDLQLAATLAEAQNSGEFARWSDATDEAAPAPLMVERALELYQLTEPWLADGFEAWDADAAHAAASCLRGLADGYAMDAVTWSPAERRTLPVARHDLLMQAMRRTGVDDWAEELGFPLELPPQHSFDEKEYDDEMLERAGDQATQSSTSFLVDFQTALGFYDLVAVLCDSRRGREVLTSYPFRWRASQQIRAARGWLWLVHHLDGAAMAVIAWLLIAQGLFVAAHGQARASAQMFPSRGLLRELVRDAELDSWPGEPDVELPQWLTETAE